jgi:peroxiredoxin Q/BCP
MLPLPLVLVVAAVSSPEVGNVAPDFSAQDTDGNTRSLAKMVKDQTVVLAFFPKAFTAG